MCYFRSIVVNETINHLYRQYASPEAWDNSAFSEGRNPLLKRGETPSWLVPPPRPSFYIWAGISVAEKAHSDMPMTLNLFSDGSSWQCDKTKINNLRLDLMMNCRTCYQATVNRYMRLAF